MHGRQNVEASLGWILPAPHASQTTPPFGSGTLLRPAAHATQDVLPPLALRQPAGQLKQNVSPSREIWPGGHASQSDSASCWLGVSALSPLNLPAAHATHDEMSALAEV
jgi:hypothetical protein